MAAETTYYKLKKPAENEFYDIQVFNQNADLIDAALHGAVAGDIDCGTFDEGLDIAAHNAAPYAHLAMNVDGNATEPADTSVTLEEHIAAENAHQNMVVDGNQN